MERMAEALACIAAWRADPDARCNCPVCGAAGVEIIDRSARPYSEWYVLKVRGMRARRDAAHSVAGAASISEHGGRCARDCSACRVLMERETCLIGSRHFLPGVLTVNVVRYPQDPTLGYAGYVELVRNEIGSGRSILLGKSFSGPVAVLVATQLGEQMQGHRACRDVRQKPLAAAGSFGGRHASIPARRPQDQECYADGPLWRSGT